MRASMGVMGTLEQRRSSEPPQAWGGGGEAPAEAERREGKLPAPYIRHATASDCHFLASENNAASWAGQKQTCR